MTNAGVEPDTYGELVARLRKRDEGYFDEADQSFGTRLDPDCQEAATAIETLERERDEARLIAEKITADSPQAATVSRIILRSGDNAARAQAAEAEVAKLRGLVERAFRNGIEYATIVKVTDPDEAWRTSRVRTALRGEP